MGQEFILKEQLKNHQLTNKPNINLNHSDLSNKSEKYQSSRIDSNSEAVFKALQLYNSFKTQESILQGLNQQLEISEFTDLKQSLSQIQVVDRAEVPLYYTKPEKTKIMFVFSSLGFLIALLIAFIKHKISHFLDEPENSKNLTKLKSAWRL